jgi:hypothetical protein
LVKAFSADEYVALNRHVSDIKASLFQISDLLTKRLGADNSLSQEAARALGIVESLNNRLLKTSERLANEAVAGDAA